MFLYLNLCAFVCLHIDLCASTHIGPCVSVHVHTCPQAAMKAVVATSRMHEGSRRRTDSCEIPASGSSTSRQSSMQQDPPQDQPGQDTPAKQETYPEQQGDAGPQNQCTPCPAPPHSPKPLTTNLPPMGGAPGCPMPTRPPLKADGLRQASVMPKTGMVQPRLPQKSCSSVEPASLSETSPVLTSPPSPRTLSNGFAVGVESGTKTAQCQ